MGDRREKGKTKSRKKKRNRKRTEKGCVWGTGRVDGCMVLYIAVVVFDVGAPEYYMLTGIRNYVDRI